MKTIVGLHIPKCAGNSILTAFTEQLHSTEVYQATSMIRNFQQQNKEFFEYSNYHALRFVFGHHVYDEMLRCFTDVYLFTLLREPVDRGISDFFFLNRFREIRDKEPLSIKEYISNAPSMNTFIQRKFGQLVHDKSASSVQQTIQILSHFDFVGTTKNIAELIKQLEMVSGLSLNIHTDNAAPKGYQDDPLYEEIRDAVQIKFADDIELFERYTDGIQASRDDNPFLIEERAEWLKSVFIEQKCDFNYLARNYLPHVMWELNDFGVLAEYVNANKRKKRFYNDLERMYNKRRVVESVGETLTTDKQAISIVRRLRDYLGKLRLRR